MLVCLQIQLQKHIKFHILTTHLIKFIYLKIYLDPKPKSMPHFFVTKCQFKLNAKAIKKILQKLLPTGQALQY